MMTQIIAHFIGDYALQSCWMANNKTKRSWPALVHTFCYSIPFLILCDPSFDAYFVIVSTHFIIDRWRLARYVVFVKEFLSPRREWKPWRKCNKTGLGEDTPPFMAIWLLIIIDNLIHISINGLALYLL